MRFVSVISLIAGSRDFREGLPVGRALFTLPAKMSEGRVPFVKARVVTGGRAFGTMLPPLA